VNAINSVIAVPGLRVVFFTQKIDESDSVLGFVCDWVTALGRRVERLHALALEVGRAPEFPDAVVLHSLGRERGRGRARLLWESQRRLRTLLSTEPVDAVIAHMAPLYAVLAYPWAARRSIPVVTWYTHRQVHPVLRVGVALSDRVLTASPNSIGIASEKVLATGHGVVVPPQSELSFEERHPKEVLAVGRITPIKRWETFIEAAALLKDKGFCFRLVGDTALEGDLPYRDRLRRLVESRGLSSSFSFAGAVPYRDMPSYYRRAFCSVNTCVDSSFDKSVLESMAFGRPALTSNRAFAPMLEGEAPELLFPEGDAPALASRIETLGELSAVDRRELGLRLRDKVERMHGLDRLMDRIVQILESTIDRKRSSRSPGPSR
jgi:glycosyltransferase involved in cell wall biosynthesis